MRHFRLAGLLILLSFTVLTALWAQTSASPDDPFVPVTTAKPASPNLVLVNKTTGLPSGYVPAGLTVPAVPTRFAATAEQSRLAAEPAGALAALFAAAERDGFKLALVSGYRSAARQAELYRAAVTTGGQPEADQSVAAPGYSEHQTGLAADIGRLDAVCDIDACFGDTVEGRWVAAHAADYGFIVRYPAGKTAVTGYEYEPWHLRYVGTAAGQMFLSGQTLEEYLRN